MRASSASSAPAASQHTPLRVLLPRADEGREDLATTLTTSGALVTAVSAYRTVAAPAVDLAPVLSRLRAGTIDILTFFSPSQVAAVASALGPDSATILNAARLIAAIGSTTADALRDRGIRVDLIPPAPSAETLAEAIRLRYAPRPEDR